VSAPHDPPGLLLSCWVPGTPKPKGSKKAIPRAGGKGVYLAEATAGSEAWQIHVAQIAHRHLIMDTRMGMEHIPPPVYSGPAVLWVTFLFIRPPGIETTYPIGDADAYDGDKLIRNVGDALSAHGSRGARCKPACQKHAGVVVDDRQFSAGRWDTQWAPDGGQAGALVEVWARP
jgi:hypothetical protein